MPFTKGTVVQINAVFCGSLLAFRSVIKVSMESLIPFKGRLGGQTGTFGCADYT